MKGQLIAEKTFTTHANHAPCNILRNIDSMRVKRYIEDYKKEYTAKVQRTIELVKDFQKFEWEIDIEFIHNSDEVMMAHVLEEDGVRPYYGFNVSIRQYVKIGKRCGRTKKKGKVNYLVAKMRNMDRQRKSSMKY